MFTFPVVLLFVCTISSVWMATPYKDCGSEAGTVQSFDVTGCTAAPCKFIKGHNYTMSLTTQAKAPSKTATIKMYGQYRLILSSNIDLVPFTFRHHRRNSYSIPRLGSQCVQLGWEMPRQCKRCELCVIDIADSFVLSFTFTVRENRTGGWWSKTRLWLSPVSRYYQRISPSTKDIWWIGQGGHQLEGHCSRSLTKYMASMWFVFFFSTTFRCIYYCF